MPLARLGEMIGVGVTTGIRTGTLDESGGTGSRFVPEGGRNTGGAPLVVWSMVTMVAMESCAVAAPTSARTASLM